MGGPSEIFTMRYEGVSSVMLFIWDAVDLTIGWGDGTFNTYNGAFEAPSHIYPSSGTYDVTIQGVLSRFQLDTGKGNMTTILNPFDPTTGSSLTSMSDTFWECTSLTSIPAGLFDNCPNVTSFANTFAYCSSLTSIPAGLFDNCPLVTNFGGTFRDCTSLTSIPSGLFDNCPNVTHFSWAFGHCYVLTSIPAGLFDGCPNALVFDFSFVGDYSLTGPSPELWLRPGSDGYFCFYQCTSLSNYGYGPSPWYGF